MRKDLPFLCSWCVIQLPLWCGPRVCGKCRKK